MSASSISAPSPSSRPHRGAAANGIAATTRPAWRCHQEGIALRRRGKSQSEEVIGGDGRGLRRRPPAGHHGRPTKERHTHRDDGRMWWAHGTSELIDWRELRPGHRSRRNRPRSSRHGEREMQADGLENAVPGADLNARHVPIVISRRDREDCRRPNGRRLS